MSLPFGLDFTSMIVGYVAGIMMYNSIALVIFNTNSKE